MVINVDVWVYSLDASDEVILRLNGLLDEEEQRRAERLLSSADARRKLVAHGRKREILAEYVSCDPRELKFACSSTGKPFLVRGPAKVPFFNLSHTGSYASLAISLDQDVGIDIEQIRDVPEGLAERYFSPRETALLAEIEDPMAKRKAFFCCWTRKEAILKATGEGLKRGLDTFSVAIDSAPWPAVLSFDGEDGLGQNWCLRHFEPNNDTLGAVAARCGARGMAVQFRRI